MVKRKASQTKKGRNYTSQNKIKSPTRKRAKISPTRRKVLTAKRNTKFKRSVSPGMVISRFSKATRKPNNISNRSERIHKTGRVTRKTTRPRTNPKKERPIYVTRSSGRQEKFDSHRMTQTVSRSGVPFLMARDITKKVVRKIGHRQMNKETSRNAKPTRNSNSQRNKNTKEVIIPGNKIRSMITEELHNRNRSDIAPSYEGQSPSNLRLEQGESIDSNAPSLHGVTTPKTNIIHDKSKYGGA